MFRKLIVPLPDWAHPDHPVLRYMLQQRRSRARLWWRLLRMLVLTLTAAVLLVLSYLIETDSGTQPASLHAILYWPLALLGGLIGASSIAATGSIISLEKTRNTWDSLRLTAQGSGLVFRARWTAAFYSLRGPLAVLILGRVLLIAAILIDLARTYRGRYLELLLSGVTPGIPVPLGAALLAATLTAVLLQPLAAVGLDAAVGLLVSSWIRQPRYDALAHALLGVVRLGLAFGSVAIGAQVFSHPEALPAGQTWLRLLLQSVAGDQGLRLLNLPQTGLLWVELPYGVYVGLALLALTVLEAWLAARLVDWAARLAQRIE